MQELGRNSQCWCGSGRKYKSCHLNFDSQMNKMKDMGYLTPPQKLLKTPEQVEGIRRSAAINMKILDYVGEHIGPGITTEEIDQWVSRITAESGAIAAPLNYDGFPKSVCTSVNHQVCHGIPSDQDVLQEGDIINVDVSTLYQGYYSDSSRMYLIGNVSKERQNLVQIAKDCIQVGLDHVKPWEPLGNLGHAIHEFAKSKGYSVVREIGGHGIGLEFHEDPWVSYVSEPNTGMIMAPGLVFTIEPMINMGAAEIYCDENDGWTIYTQDGMDSGQWEVQVLVTEKGYEILCS